MLKNLEKLLGLGPERVLKKIQPIYLQIENLGAELAKKSDAELITRISELKENLQSKDWEYKKLQKALDEILPETFAIVREASTRVLGMRHFPVQCLGGVVLHQGKIAEMKTGEGKTLVATLPAVLNALSGKGVHIVTVNDYLATRDSEFMGRLYDFLGLSCGLVVPNQTQSEKKRAYQSDILYATNNELGFDYLRDNMAESVDSQSRKGFNYAIVDEVDSVLIDEARTPLIISGLPETSKKEIYLVMQQLSGKLRRAKDKEDETGDYYIDEKAKNVILTDRGIQNAEKALKVDDLWSIESNLAHHLLQSLKAKELFKRDSDYVVQNNPENRKKEVVIVDEFTGRLMNGRRWSDGLHQAIEAKEKVGIQEETLTLAGITFQNFFKLYPKLSGMTGTALTEEEEFKNIYNLSVVPIPTNKKNIRKDDNDRVYKNEKQKFYAIVQEIVSAHKKGTPVLVGTTSIDKSEKLSEMLSKPRASVELLQFRVDRLKRSLQEINPIPTDFIKDIDRLVDKPLNITYLAAKTICEKALENENTSGKLKKSLEDALNSTDFSISNVDTDLTCFIETFLSSAMVLEEIRKGVKHNVLNAKHHAKEAQIIAQAGRYKAITIATNMAGRGTDILLGGNAEYLAKEKIKNLQLASNSLEYEAALNEAMEKIRPELEEESKKVLEAGGLFVIGTERHESRRIDNQLRGRAARQGDPGKTLFFLALDDQLMRIFGGDRLTGAMDFLKAEEDLAIEAKLVNKGIENAQKKVEAHNYEIRKRLLEYDNVQDTQRKVIYEERQKILENCDLRETFLDMLRERIDSIIYSYLDPEKPPESWFESVRPDDSQDNTEEEIEDTKEFPSHLDLMLSSLFAEIPPLQNNQSLRPSKLQDMSFAELTDLINQSAISAYKEKENELTPEVMSDAEKQVFLQSIDQHWVEHLQSLDALKEGIHLRGYGNKQPLIEYKTEALSLFDQLISSIRKHAIIWIFHTHAIKVKKEAVAAKA
ncbi:MAG: preprotein translocase subunit SecA [Candidatus Caenarcaniphilales bacterium]|nr:preprotein translocase subunit SecA [Candidatus Caenarcaniphilales bacterium]